VWSVGTDGGSFCHLFVGERQCGFWAGGAAAPVWDAAANLEVLLLASAPKRTGWLRPPKVKIWLSGQLARPFLFGPVQGLKSDAEAREIARAKVRDSTSLEKALDVRIDGDPRREPAVATVVSNETVKRVQRLVAGVGLRSVSIRPWWAAATVLPTASADATLLAVHDGESLTLLAEGGGRWMSVDSYPVGDQMDESRTLIRRRALGLGIASTMLVHLTPEREDRSDGGVACWPILASVEIA